MLSPGREAQTSAKLKGQSRRPIIFYGRRDNVDQGGIKGAGLDVTQTSGTTDSADRRLTMFKNFETLFIFLRNNHEFN